MRRPLWTYRPLLCMLGLHDTSQRRAATLVVDETYGHGSATHYGIVHTYGYRVIEECDRPRCGYSAEVSPPVAAPWSLPEPSLDYFEPSGKAHGSDRKSVV